MDNIHIPVSPGELLDKITILEIKAEQISDNERLRNVETELNLLAQVWEQSSVNSDSMRQLKQSLKATNLELWAIEDRIRIKESQKEFDQEFVELARSVYMQNDKRAATKKEINVLLDSGIMEEKSYAQY